MFPPCGLFLFYSNLPVFTTLKEQKNGHTEKPGGESGLFLFFYEGGDSEFINYLTFILLRNCVHFVSKI